MAAEHHEADGQRRREHEADRTPQHGPEGRRRARRRRAKGRCVWPWKIGSMTWPTIGSTIDEQEARPDQHRPARVDGGGERQRKGRRDHRADIGHEAQDRGEDAPQRRRSARRWPTGRSPITTPKPELMASCIRNRRESRAPHRPAPPSCAGCRASPQAGSARLRRSSRCMRMKMTKTMIRPVVASGWSSGAIRLAMLSSGPGIGRGDDDRDRLDRRRPGRRVELGAATAVPLGLSSSLPRSCSISAARSSVPSPAEAPRTDLTLSRIVAS